MGRKKLEYDAKVVARAIYKKKIRKILIELSLEYTEKSKGIDLREFRQPIYDFIDNYHK